jgi:hypothetical protein
LGPVQQLKSRHAFYLRLAAGFPAIAKLRTEFPDWEFTADELNWTFGWDCLGESLYRTQIKLLVESSAKIPVLTAILADAARYWRADVNAGKLRAKAIVLTYTPALLAVLITYFGLDPPEGIKFVVVTTNIKMPERTRMIDRFCNCLDYYSKPVHQDAADADMLLSLTCYCCTGHNMPVADTIVLFDPEWIKKDQDQAFACIYRQGQTKQTYLYLLYNSANPIEYNIISRQNACSRITEMSWKVSTEEAEKVQTRLRRRKA